MTRRFVSGIVGVLLVMAAVFATFGLTEDAYYNYFFFPKIKKDEYIIPTRWQDVVALIVLWGGTILLWYAAYRLLRYAVRPRKKLEAGE